MTLKTFFCVLFLVRVFPIIFREVIDVPGVKRDCLKTKECFLLHIVNMLLLFLRSDGIIDNKISPLM